MNLNFDYSIIKNRTNTNNDLSGKDFHKIHNFLHAKHKFDIKHHNVWYVLQAIGRSAHFNMSTLLIKNSSKQITIKDLDCSKFYKYINKQLSPMQWKQFILDIMSLLHISRHEINIHNKYFVQQRQLISKNHRVLKRSIRFHNLLKVEDDFFNKNKVVILTKWQIYHIDDCSVLIYYINKLLGLAKKNPNTRKADPTYYMPEIQNAVIDLDYGNVLYDKQDKKFRKSLPKSKTLSQWKKFLLSYLKSTCLLPDYNFVVKTLKGNTKMYDQFKYQFRDADKLLDEGQPIESFADWFFYYSCPRADKSKLIHNPARKFYKHNKKWQKKQMHKARLKLVKDYKSKHLI